MGKYKKTVTAKNVISYFTEHISSFLDRDDSLLSKDAIDMLSSQKGREELLGRLEMLKNNRTEFDENSPEVSKELESTH